MKNITLSVDDETYRNARIRAAERGVSVSALVKDYLKSLSVDAPTASGFSDVEQAKITNAADLGATLQSMLSGLGDKNWPSVDPSSPLFSELQALGDQARAKIRAQSDPSTARQWKREEVYQERFSRWNREDVS